MRPGEQKKKAPELERLEDVHKWHLATRPPRGAIRPRNSVSGSSFYYFWKDDRGGVRGGPLIFTRATVPNKGILP